ncbi:MAG: GNAT family N-acetyltransferase [Candidatus Aenigmarchaeota archaeon]|nr:GNAT family N-acetyltransferase [Candidatus Aenigmarchaeota archaeon]MDI6722158.1 GNAT family N-acetyltransferase [Candidatus Aenigmarchaeota archaeon]
MDDFQKGLREEKKIITDKIIHDETAQKFYIPYEDDEAVLAYTRVNDILDVHHVYVPESARDHGIAESLATAAFEYAETNGLKIIPTCPYIKDTFLKKHPEWNNTVTEAYF